MCLSSEKDENGFTFESCQKGKRKRKSVMHGPRWCFTYRKILLFECSCCHRSRGQLSFLFSYKMGIDGRFPELFSLLCTDQESQSLDNTIFLVGFCPRTDPLTASLRIFKKLNMFRIVVVLSPINRFWLNIEERCKNTDRNCRHICRTKFC